MDDCCRITELLLGGPSSGDPPLTIGILEIVSTRHLTVAATYTVTSASGKVDLDAQSIPAKLT
jgi:hypothetical protein